MKSLESETTSLIEKQLTGMNNLLAVFKLWANLKIRNARI